MPWRWHLFARDEILPSYYENALQAFLSTVVSQLRIRPVTATAIEAVASTNDGLSAVTVDGNPRFRESSVQRSHPGGAAGTYDVFVTAAEDNISSSPQPFTDLTNYSFDLAIVASGGTPAIVPGTVDVHRKVAEVQWSGTEITEVRQLVGADDQTQPVRPTARHAKEVPMRARGAAGQTADLGRIEFSDGTAAWRILPDGSMVADLAAGSVDTDELADGAVTNAKVGDAAVSVAKTGTADGGLARGCFSAHRVAALSIVQTVEVPIVFDAEEFDVSGWYDTATGIFTPQVAGYYRFSTRVSLEPASIDDLVLWLQKNGVAYKTLDRLVVLGGQGSGTSVSGSAIAHSNGTTDAFRISVLQTGGGSPAAVLPGQVHCYFQGEFIGRS